MRLRLWCCLIVSAVGVVLGKATIAGQVRDPGTQPAVGTGTIAGSVIVDDISARPIRRATVTISAGEIRGSRTAATDESGRFAFTALPPGRYSLSAQKTGYLRTQFGASRVGQTTPEPVQLTAGQQLGGLTIKLPRGAVVTGIVTEGSGRPMSGTRMMLLQYRFINAERVLMPAPTGGVANGGMTDDRGIYRIYGLAPGEYVVAAQPQGGTMNDVRPITNADIQWAQRQIQRASSGAMSGAVQGAPGTDAANPTPASTVGYAPMFYPGTPDPRTALVVKLTAGEERMGLDFAVPLVRTAKIEGTIVDPSGRSLREVPININRVGQPQGMGSSIAVRSMPEGKFVATGVPPGQYVITARTNPAPPSAPPPPPPPGAVGFFPAPPMMAGSNEFMWAMTEVDIDGTDLSGVTLTLQPGLTATARVAFEATALTPPSDMSGVRLMLGPAMPGANFPVSGSTAAVQPDGTLLFKNLMPATYRLTAGVPNTMRTTGPGGVWIVKSVVVNGRDLTDRPITIRPNDQLALAVNFSDRPAEISGKLLTATGQPATNFAIVLFTTDQTFWGLQSRRTVQARPQSDGQYRIGNLPPGEYYMAALTSLESNDMADPGFFDQLIPASFKITLGEGEKKVQDLKLAGG